VRTVKLVALAVAAFRVVTLVVERLEVPVTFKFVPKIEAAFRFVTLVVERLEVPVTLRDPPKREAAFMIAALPLVKTFRVAMFACVLTVMFVVLAVAEFRVATLVVERLEFPATFIVVQKTKGTVSVL